VFLSEPNATHKCRRFSATADSTRSYKWILKGKIYRQQSPTQLLCGGETLCLLLKYKVCIKHPFILGFFAGAVHSSNPTASRNSIISQEQTEKQETMTQFEVLLSNVRWNWKQSQKIQISIIGLWVEIYTRNLTQWKCHTLNYDVPNPVLNPGSRICQSPYPVNEPWPSCMPFSCLTPYWTLALLYVSCLTPYWTLAVLYVSQLPDTALNTSSLVCQSATWHRTEHWLSCMLVSCLTLWINPGLLACPSVVWSSEWTLDPLHVRQLPDPVTTLALLHVSQLPDPVNETWLSCISITLQVRQYSEGCEKTEGDIWATKEKNKPKQRMTVQKNASVNKLMTMTYKGAFVVWTIMYSKDS